MIGSALGGLVASVWGVTAPFWFAFAGSALILAAIWRSLLNIAHADEHTRASAPTAPSNGLPRPARMRPERWRAVKASRTSPTSSSETPDSWLRPEAEVDRISKTV